MPEPLAEQIVQAVETSLEGIVSDAGVTYWYTPDSVVRASFNTQVNLDEFQGHLYIVRPGSSQERLRTTAGGFEAELELFVTCARKDLNLSSNPHQQDPAVDSVWLVQERMLEDVKKKLRADIRGWGLGVVSLECPDQDKDAHVEGWALAHLLVLIRFLGRRA